MKADVTSDGLKIPKSLLDGVDTVEIRREGGQILIIPLNGAPIVDLKDVGDSEETRAKLNRLLAADDESILMPLEEKEVGDKKD